MQTIETIRTIKTRNFTVKVRAVADEMPQDLSWDESGEVAEKLETGELMAFGVIVTIYCQGAEVAMDSLWNCIYERPSAFMDHLGIKAKGRADGRNYGSYFTDMVRTACDEARKALCDMRNVRVRC